MVSMRVIATAETTRDENRFTDLFRTLEEHSFITSKGLSLVCLMCLVHLSMHLLAGILQHVYAIGMQMVSMRVVATAGTAHDENHFTDLFRELLRNILL
jgi:hypothetical protein